MWEDVKPISLSLEQKNKDGSYFILNFYSNDYELIKLRDACHYDADGKFVGDYSRLSQEHFSSVYTANFFIDKLTEESIKKIIEYYENANLYIEYFI